MNMDRITRALIKLPGGKALVRMRERSRAQRRFAQRNAALNLRTTADVFRHYFEAESWGNAETVSGAGSTLLYTANIRKELPVLVEALGVRVVLDAPCGDFNWCKVVEWKTPVSYLGGDIVEPLVERNQSLYGTEDRNFLHLDIVNTPLPSADLWLCRDCLFHLSERDIFFALDNFLRSDIEYMLTSIHGECVVNTDIPTGGFRLLNLELPPFRLGPPLRLIEDWIPGYPVRYLALWRREALREALAPNRAFRRAIRGRA
jgi:hypothetical protein